jgi:hypothetical protein
MCGADGYESVEGFTRQGSLLETVGGGFIIQFARYSQKSRRLSDWAAEQGFAKRVPVRRLKNKACSCAVGVAMPQQRMSQTVQNRQVTSEESFETKRLSDWAAERLALARKQSGPVRNRAWWP